MYNTPKIQKHIMQSINNNSTTGYTTVIADGQVVRIPSPRGFKQKLNHAFRINGRIRPYRLTVPSQLNLFDYPPETYKQATRGSVVYVIEVLEDIDAEGWNDVMNRLNRELSEYITELKRFKVAKLDRRLLIMYDNM